MMWMMKKTKNKDRKIHNVQRKKIEIERQKEIYRLKDKRNIERKL